MKLHLYINLYNNLSYALGDPSCGAMTNAGAGAVLDTEEVSGIF